MILRRTIFLALAVLFIGGCGSATEVGNPTGQVPTTRIIKGVIDPATLNTTLDVYYDIDLATLTVQASATGGSMVDSPVAADGSFSLIADVGTSYTMEVLQDGTSIGNFSFEQNDLGTRANRIQFDLPGADVDLGEVQFRDRTFRPQYEPRFHEGFNPFSGPPPPADYYETAYDPE